MTVIGASRWKFINGNIKDSRIIPYLPSFRRTAARIIDPATGASTWAFGSHKWTVYIGIFTRNAMIVINHQKDLRDWLVGITQKLRIINKDLLVLKIIIRLKRRGRDAVTVYKIKYEDAWSRSGWAPHVRIRNNVGIKDASNLI